MKVIIEISGNDVDKLSAESIADFLFMTLSTDGFDVTVTGDESDD